MPCDVVSGCIVGVTGVPVRVEVDILRRLPATQIVGLAAGAVREAAERVRSAVHSAGMEWPRMRVVVNLAPADLRKDGTAFDLPIALGVLAGSGQLGTATLQGRVFAGELSLSGELRPVRGTLSLALMARAAGFRELVVPRTCASEAAVVEGLVVTGVDHLRQVVDYLEGREQRSPPVPTPPSLHASTLDLSEVRGQLLARRALEVAAAGGHNLLMVGPPGCGKTMLSSRMPTILPPLTEEERIEATCIHSVAGLREPGQGLLDRRPFRAPHHSISAAGMLGNAFLRPGEVSLAHTGVLFLDELPEFMRHVLEMLRDPLENRRIVLSRAAGSVVFPASFSLVAAANPCPCGFRGHPRRACGCSDEAVARYFGRISGPLLDRIDLHVELLPVDTESLVAGVGAESSAAVRGRVVAARSLQGRRYAGSPIRCNADLGGEQARQAADLTGEAGSLVRSLVDACSLSGRAHARVLKVARTIADLDGAPRVDVIHVAEAIQYRAWDQALAAAEGASNRLVGAVA